MLIRIEQCLHLEKQDKPMSLASKIALIAHLPPPILSAYLDINPRYPRNQSTPRGYIRWLKSAGQALLRELPQDSQKAFRLQLRRVDRYLKTGRPGSQSLVIFAGARVWEVIALRVEVTEELHWGTRPCIRWHGSLTSTGPAVRL